MNKVSVLQEAKSFHAAGTTVRKSSIVLTKLLIILNQQQGKIDGDSSRISASEANDTFFAITKLFQNRDAFLRRLVYICIKELVSVAPSIDAIIVTSSLIRDMTGAEDAYRAPAIRALWRISDASMLGSIERYMKNALVHKSANVASSALVCAYWMSLGGGGVVAVVGLGDAVRRWTNEMAEALRQHRNSLVQYHALAVLYRVKHTDKLALVKLVLARSRGAASSSSSSSAADCNFADVFAIRVAARLVQSAGGEEQRDELLRYIESCLKFRGDMVALEAARALVSIDGAAGEAVNTLRALLEAKKPVSRFAAVKTLSELAGKRPELIGPTCNLDLEALVGSPNRVMATLAITTLLNTETEPNIEALIKQLSGFMSEINDEFRTNIVDAVRGLCLKFPGKQASFMRFLSSLIREEGGVAFKSAIVDCITAIIEQNPAAREAGLSSLCEFIEDCEHEPLATRILHLIGQLGGGGGGAGTKTAAASAAVRRYVRYIYNRVMLESAAVRAAALTALAKLALSDASVLSPIRAFVDKSCTDPDDEVRDRACFYRKLLSSEELTAAARRIFADVTNVPAPSPAIHFSAQQHLALSDESFPRLFALKSSQHQQHQQQQPEQGESVAAQAANQWETPVEVLAELGDDRTPFKTCAAVELTEPELEFTVRCVKIVHRAHVLLRFHVSNTLDDVALTAVRIGTRRRRPPQTPGASSSRRSSGGGGAAGCRTARPGGGRGSGHHVRPHRATRPRRRLHTHPQTTTNNNNIRRRRRKPPPQTAVPDGLQLRADRRARQQRVRRPTRARLNRDHRRRLHEA